MRNKLSILCDRVLEAGWLVALIVEPLFFNVYSSRVFEPDKLSLLRSIALLLVAVWGIRLIEEAGGTSAATPQPSWWARLRAIPLALPTLALIVVYLVATALSVVPGTSFWGSYQRLQGTYTTLSYMVIFATLLSTLRRREQVERLIVLAILVSLPIALYGLMQHHKLDPLPWGGDVTVRVASNLGNSIFVAAYLIMIVPLTLRNLLQALGEVLHEEETRVKAAFLAGYLVALLLQIVAWVGLGFIAGLVLGAAFTFLLAIYSFSIRKPPVRFLWIGAYSVILVAQLITIFFTQSRGPWLGLLGGVFFFVLILAFAQRIRWLQWTSIALAAAGVLFLVLLNIPNTPLEPIKRLPYIGRLGRVFETDKGTGKVRMLIWEGAVELIGWHEPIGLPERKDPWNALRPLIGYGPEAMYVAYNPFYPPDLAHYERRNASPDRSHNETFDALVQTGLIGFVVYFALFASIFYYGLKWLGLIEERRHTRLFLLLAISGALLGALLPLLLEGTLKYTGVGVPFGFIAGVGLYLIVSSFMVSQREGQRDGRQLLLIALLAAIVAHFVEIHFGIAIAATRTYFWAYAALLVVLGMGRVSGWDPLVGADLGVGSPNQGEHASSPLPVEPAHHPAGTKGGVRKQKARKRAIAAPAPLVGQGTTAWPWSGVLAYALLVGLLLITMSYDFITNQQGVTSSLQVITNSLTVLSRSDADVRSWAMLALFGFTWLVGGVLALTQLPQGETGGRRLLQALGLYALVTSLSWLLFTLPHAASLQPGIDVARIVAPYYVALFVMLAAVALALWRETPLPALFSRPARRVFQAIAVPASLALVALLIVSTNINIVKADIYYKQAKHYDGQSNWDVAIRLYQESMRYAPDEDFYYLFLGRAYLEKSATVSDANQRLTLIDRARQTLETARKMNPLNTDHSANLGRLYRTWAEMTTEPDKRQELLNQAIAYYEDATTLSPNNAQLYNEWGLVYALQGDFDTAFAKYDISLSLDQQYEQTHLYMGNIYLNQKRYDEAVVSYQAALAVRPSLVQAHSALGYVYSQQGKLEEAVDENLKVLASAPKDYASHKNLAILYQQLGRLPESLAQAKEALAVAPESEKSPLQSFITQVEGLIKQGGGG